MNVSKNLRTSLLSALFSSALSASSFGESKSDGGNLVRYGGMHETIGLQNHQGRVDLSQLLEQPHFYAVGALAGLDGEITILDSKAIVTTVDSSGNPSAQSGGEATLLVGQSVPAWTDVEITEDIPPAQIDEAVRELVSGSGINPSSPFIFVIEGSYSAVRLHVINGACPVHAQKKDKRIPEDRQPYELATEAVAGTVVGVYAEDAAGQLTHPGTSQHAHLIYPDPASGQRVTGHLEPYGVKRGATLKLPNTVMPSGEDR